jgi:hypothetical protein
MIGVDFQNVPPIGANMPRGIRRRLVTRNGIAVARYRLAK